MTTANQGTSSFAMKFVAVPIVERPLTESPPPRRFRFGLRTLFVLVTVVAISIALAVKFPGSIWFTGWSAVGWGVGTVFGQGARGGLWEVVFAMALVVVGLLLPAVQ